MHEVNIKIFIKSKEHTVDATMLFARLDEIRPFVENINKNGFFVCLEPGNKLSYVKDVYVLKKKNISWISPNHISQIHFGLGKV